MSGLAKYDAGIPAAQISVHEDLQPRVRIDGELAADYFEAMCDGSEFPPVVVFFDGGKYWLADGYHRYHAVKGSETEQEIPADIREGTFRDAVAYSVQANRDHGWRRSKGDIAKAFATAVRYTLVDPTDADSVRQDLRCSRGRAFELTEPHRVKAKAERDRQIAEKRAEGKTHQQISDETGVPRRTVTDVLGEKSTMDYSPKHIASSADSTNQEMDKAEAWKEFNKNTARVLELAKPWEHLFEVSESFERWPGLDQLRSAKLIKPLKASLKDKRSAIASAAAYLQTASEIIDER